MTACCDTCTKEGCAYEEFCHGADYNPMPIFLVKDKSGRTWWGQWRDENAAKFFADSADMEVIGKVGADDERLL